MKRWRWLSPATVVAVHEMQLAEHGSAAGVRDAGLLESALARPQQLAAYGEPDLVDVAAALGYGLARNHPSMDGNKRTSLVCMFLFIEDNGAYVTVDEAECLPVMLDLAAGKLTETELAAWLRTHVLID